MKSAFADHVSYLDMIQPFLRVKILSEFLSVIFNFDCLTKLDSISFLNTDENNQAKSFLTDLI